MENTSTPAPGESAAPSCSASEWGVYQYEPGETYLARSAQEAYDAYVSDVGTDSVIDEMSPSDFRKLSDEELEQRRFSADCDFEPIAGKTFSEVLTIEAASPEVRARQFSTMNV